MRGSLDSDCLAWRLARRPASGVTCSKLTSPSLTLLIRKKGMS